MKDIINAIKAEQEYINSGNGSIYDYLSPFGYEELDEYFFDKKEYLFNQVNYEFYNGTIDNIVEVINNYFKKGVSAVLIPHADTTFVWTGIQPFNEQYCIDNNIPVKNLGYNGGTIVTGKGDFSIMIIFPNTIDVNSDYILGKFCEILEKFESGFSVAENDILQNGNKVAGSIFMEVGNFHVFAMELSLDNHSEAISNICMKPAIKTPSWVHNATAEQIEEEVVRWLRL